MLREPKFLHPGPYKLKITKKVKSSQSLRTFNFLVVWLCIVLVHRYLFSTQKQKQYWQNSTFLWYCFIFWSCSRASNKHFIHSLNPKKLKVPGLCELLTFLVIFKF